jgi:hypothetical protein
LRRSSKYVVKFAGRRFGMLSPSGVTITPVSMPSHQQYHPSVSGPHSLIEIVESELEIGERINGKQRRQDVDDIINIEQDRVRDFVKETQRTAEHLVLGIHLVEDGNEREVGRARDGGLWDVPIPGGEMKLLKEVCKKYQVHRARYRS